MKRRLPTKEVVSDLSKIGAAGTVIGVSATKAKSGEKPVIDVSKKQLIKNQSDIVSDTIVFQNKQKLSKKRISSNISFFKSGNYKWQIQVE